MNKFKTKIFYALFISALATGIFPFLVFATTPVPPDITAPSVPSRLAARAINHSQINLSWGASSDTGGSRLKGYNVYRNGSYLKQVLTTSTSDTGLAGSTIYSYAVSTVDNAGNESARSSAVSATTPAPPDTTAPSVPAGLTASAINHSQINLSWGASSDTGGSGLKGYNVYRNGWYVKRVLAPSTSTSDIGLAASTVYSYAVSAIDNAGNRSAKSSATSAATAARPDTTVPSVPRGLAARAISCNQIDLSWSASTDTGGSRLKGYNVYRNGSYLKQVLTTSTSDTGLGASTIYSYAVSAIDNSGNESAKSSATSATTPAPPPDVTAPSVPAGLTAGAISCSQINLSWGASTDTGGSGLKGYNVYRNGSYLKQVLTTSTSDTGLAASTVYSYSVSAIDNSGNESAKGSAASATTPACPDTTAPSVPAGLTAGAISCSQINLSWGASTDTGGSGLKGYNVYRNGSYLKQVLTTSTSDTGLAASRVYS
jgi:chitodextrinase